MTNHTPPLPQNQEASPKRCPRHEWFPAFPGPDGETERWFGGGQPYRWSQYLVCANCRRYAVKGNSGNIRALPAHEVKAYNVQGYVDVWREHVQKWADFFGLTPGSEANQCPTS